MISVTSVGLSTCPEEMLLEMKKALLRLILLHSGFGEPGRVNTADSAPARS